MQASMRRRPGAVNRISGCDWPPRAACCSFPSHGLDEIFFGARVRGLCDAAGHQEHKAAFEPLAVGEGLGRFLVFAPWEAAEEKGDTLLRFTRIVDALDVRCGVVGASRVTTADVRELDLDIERGRGLLRGIELDPVEVAQASLFDR